MSTTTADTISASVRKPALKPLMFLPGALFWGLVIGGATTNSPALITGGVLVAATMVTILVTRKVRASNAAKAERERLWREGRQATARVVAIASRGGLNNNPYIELELDVAVDGREYRAYTVALIDRLAIPRIQPQCEIAVRVDPRDSSKLMVDRALTPH